MAHILSICLTGAFAVDTALTRDWFRKPNVNGESNQKVLRPIW